MTFLWMYSSRKRLTLFLVLYLWNKVFKKLWSLHLKISFILSKQFASWGDLLFTDTKSQIEDFPRTVIINWSLFKKLQSFNIRKVPFNFTVNSNILNSHFQNCSTIPHCKKICSRDSGAFLHKVHCSSFSAFISCRRTPVYKPLWDNFQWNCLVLGSKSESLRCDHQQATIFLFLSVFSLGKPACLRTESPDSKFLLAIAISLRYTFFDTVSFDLISYNSVKKDFSSSFLGFWSLLCNLCKTSSGKADNRLWYSFSCLAVGAKEYFLLRVSKLKKFSCVESQMCFSFRMPLFIQWK